MKEIAAIVGRFVKENEEFYLLKYIPLSKDTRLFEAIRKDKPVRWNDVTKDDDILLISLKVSKISVDCLRKRITLSVPLPSYDGRARMRRTVIDGILSERLTDYEDRQYRGTRRSPFHREHYHTLQIKTKDRFYTLTTEKRNTYL